MRDDPKHAYIIYLKKNGRYTKPFTATDDIQAKLITRRIHGKECGDIVALFRMKSPNKIGQRRLKGIQL